MSCDPVTGLKNNPKAPDCVCVTPSAHWDPDMAPPRTQAHMHGVGGHLEEARGRKGRRPRTHPPVSAVCCGVGQAHGSQKSQRSETVRHVGALRLCWSPHARPNPRASPGVRLEFLSPTPRDPKEFQVAWSREKPPSSGTASGRLYAKLQTDGAQNSSQQWKQEG